MINFFKGNNSHPGTLSVGQPWLSSKKVTTEELESWKILTEEELNNVRGGGNGILQATVDVGGAVDPVTGDPVHGSIETNVNAKLPAGAVKTLVNNLTAPGP